MSVEPEQPRALDCLVELRLEKIAGRKDPRRPYVGLEHMAQGSPTLLGSLPGDHSVSVNSVFEPNDILFGKLRPNLRKSLLAPFAGYCSTDILVLRAKEGVDFRFAAHVFQWEPVFAAAIRTAAGTKMPRTSWNELRRFRLLKPRDLAEQGRIAAILDLMDAAIGKSAAVIAKLKQIRAGLLHDLLTRGLDENGELRDPFIHREQFNDTQLGRIPKAWEIGGVCQMATNCDARRIPVKQADRDKQQGIYPYYGASGIIDFVDDFLFDGEYVLVAEDGENLRSRELPVAFIASGKFWVNNHAHILEARSNTNVHFLEVLLESQNYARWLIGSAQPKLTQKGLEGIRMAIPPLREQEQIAERVRAFDTRLQADGAELGKLQQLKVGLMSDLLFGRVGVPNKIEIGAAP